jgi:hypothetical protein
MSGEAVKGVGSPIGVGRSRRHYAITVAFLAFTVVGCSGPKVTTQASGELSRYQIRTIALVPFAALATPQVRDLGEQYVSTPKGARGSDISIAIPSSAEPPLRETEAVPEYAPEKVTQLFWSRLKDRKTLTVLSPSSVAHAAGSLKDEERNMTPETRAAALARMVSADATMIGRVSVYQERVGSRLGANPPATVGFEVKVIAKDGQVLWVGNYYERQRPMTEDFLGFLQRWGAFVTAEELARYGVDAVLKVFPFGTQEE